MRNRGSTSYHFSIKKTLLSIKWNTLTTVNNGSNKYGTLKFNPEEIFGK